jgi:hypothetical protein
MSVPLSNKWVAKQWRSTWLVTRFSIPAFLAARVTASPYTFGCRWCRRRMD